jgi:hypothetical protein
MRKVRIPTILGILVLVIGVIVGVFLVQSRQIFRLRASPEITPRNIQKTNISDTTFTISWVTDKSTEGFIRWGNSPSNLDKTATSSPANASSTHSITVYGLSASTSYYFRINSDGTNFDNDGIPWEVKTGTRLDSPPSAVVISGTILTQTDSPAQNVLVYAKIGGGSMLSTVTSENGTWAIPVSSARNQSLDSNISIDEASTLVEISVQAGSSGVASAQIYPQSAKPAPDITIGEVYDFTNLPPSESLDLPESSIDMPESATKSSGFQLSEDINKESVTLEGVKEGDVVTTTEPEFFGEGPPGTELLITVESDPQSENVEVNSNGFWRWSPPEGLEEGIHKITITWRDTEGILQTLTRSFTVSAQEGPAFTATPSASPTPTRTPTETPIPTVTPTTQPGATTTPTQTPTNTPTPTRATTTPAEITLPNGEKPGIGLPTIALLLLGTGFLVIASVLFSFSPKGKQSD